MTIPLLTLEALRFAIIAWFIVMAIGALAVVLSIGKPRRPSTPLSAVVTLVLLAFWAYVLLCLAHYAGIVIL